MTWLREKWDSERRMSDERKGDTVDTMTDLHELAKQVWDKIWPRIKFMHDMQKGSHAQHCINDITAALAQVREDCAKVADDHIATSDPYDPAYGFSCACRKIAAAIRQGVARGRREP